MSRKAWAYIYLMLATGLLMTLWAASQEAPSPDAWGILAALALATTLAQLFEARAPGHQSYYTHLVFLFAGLLLLPPVLFTLLVTAPHLVEWIEKRLTNSPQLRAWYLQPCNVANHIISGIAAYAMVNALGAWPRSLVSASAIPAVVIAAIVYVVLNHALVGMALKLARGISWRTSGVMSSISLSADLLQLALGYVGAILWQLSPVLILPALSPLLLIHRALKVPELEHEAQTDPKTGLLNAGHFRKTMEAELDRARRFDRPLALIMADLDYLRNINNTHGHLAGDTVLIGIASIIQATVRQYDVAARFGGEEFAIALPESGAAQAEEIAERIRQRLAESHFQLATGATIGATVSIGVAVFPQDANDLAELIHSADLALYQAKAQGRNRVVSAVEVPRAAMLEQVEPDAGTDPTVSASTGVQHPPVAAQPRPQRSSPPPAPEPADKAGIAFWLSWALIVGAGLFVAWRGAGAAAIPDLPALLLLAAIAVVAELKPMRQGTSTFSVSAAVLFAAALTLGFPGLVCISGCVAITHRLRTRPFRLDQAAYRTPLNWSIHVLACIPAALIGGRLGLPLELRSALSLLVLALVAALWMYAIDTGLTALAIGLNGGTSARRVWREEFAWLAGEYLLYALLGLLLALALTELGLLGGGIFALPLALVRQIQDEGFRRSEDYVDRLKRVNQELNRANNEVVRASQAIGSLNDELLQVLAKIIDARDRGVYDHSTRVARLAVAVAEEMGLPEKRRELIRQAAFLHDIGKIGVSEQILQKPGRLSDEQFRRVQSHAALGAEFLETCAGLRHLAAHVRQHHERWDGSGYPSGLRGEEITPEARILSVCDAVEAMSASRAYSPAMPFSTIVTELKQCAGSQFDPAVAEAFIRIAEREGARLLSLPASSGNCLQAPAMPDGTMASVAYP